MLLHTPLRKSWEWETRMRMAGYLARYFSSHTHDSMSRWLVGSSRRRSAGCERRARPSATRMRHPPERSWVFFLRKSCEKPRPIRISVARNSNVFGSIRSIRS
mmetsp:Transcript_17398/g.41929  ORF Transcript_17398/g.41929 Transcript_17398/m.41929 type:complete len:103 (+) Transcript_17398:1063-1371(+)